MSGPPYHYVYDRNGRFGTNERHSVANILLVEGSSDVALFMEIAKRVGKIDVELFDMNGKHAKWSNAIKFALSGPEGLAVRSIGLVVDADTDGDAAVASAAKYLKDAGLTPPRAKKVKTVQGSFGRTQLSKPSREVLSGIFVMSKHGKSVGNLDDLVLKYLATSAEFQCLNAFEDCLERGLSVKSKIQAGLAAHPRKIPSIERAFKTGVIDSSDDIFKPCENWLTNVLH